MELLLTSSFLLLPFSIILQDIPRSINAPFGWCESEDLGRNWEICFEGETLKRNYGQDLNYLKKIVAKNYTLIKSISDYLASSCASDSTSEKTNFNEESSNQKVCF